MEQTDWTFDGNVEHTTFDNFIYGLIRNSAATAVHYTN